MNKSQGVTTGPSTNPSFNSSIQNSNPTNQEKKDQSKNEEIIVIHVCDENRKLNKDFKCEKKLLYSRMKYFEKYLLNTNSLEDIDISVHCDINIFDWLMKYIHTDGPKLGRTIV
jgi:hypothetical protein